jgi:outer membrane lipoprotein carrier protein
MSPIWYNIWDMFIRGMILTLAALSLPAAAPHSSAPAQATPQEIVARFEKTIRSLTAFQADFEQTSTTSSLSTPLREKGLLSVKKDDLMRWDYSAPEKKTFVFNAGLLQSYFPEDNQLWRQKFAPEDYEGDIPAILTGKARLAERYDVETSPFPGASPGSPQLKLTPKAEEDGSFILIEIDPSTWMLRRAVLFDWAGNKTEFAFSRFKANPRLDARFFEVKVPADCEIIDGEPQRKK